MGGVRYSVVFKVLGVGGQFQKLDSSDNRISASRTASSAPGELGLRSREAEPAGGVASPSQLVRRKERLRPRKPELFNGRFKKEF